MSEKTINTTGFSELTALGIKFYEENLKTILEPQHNGEFVAIEPYSGNYFLNKNHTQAILDARAAMPDKLFFVARIGTIYTAKLRNYVPRKTAPVNENFEAFLAIRLTNDSLINCLLDTGFNGTLFLPREFVEKNDLPFGASEILQAAENQNFEVDTATAEVEWLGGTSSVTVFVSEMGEAIVGAEMFADAALEIDYINRTVKITK